MGILGSYDLLPERKAVSQRAKLTFYCARAGQYPHLNIIQHVLTSFAQKAQDTRLPGYSALLDS